MTNETTPSSGVSIRNPKSAIGNPVAVSAGLVFRNGLLLITQRRAQDHLGGLWEFPGGKRHEGESDEDCLKRELVEELDIEVEVRELVETVTHQYPGKGMAVCVKFFRCAWLRNEPRAIGCQDLAWVDRKQLADYQFPAADAQLLKRLKTIAEFWI